MSSTKYGKQPALAALQSQGRTVAATARVLGINPNHFYNALVGRCAPGQTVRQRLPEALGMPLEILFTKAALGARLNAHIGAQPKRGVR